MIPTFLRKILAGAMAGPKSENASKDGPRLKACLFKVDGIGDFVLALGALRQLTRYYGEENCGMIVWKPVADLARKEFPRATVITLQNYGGRMKEALELFFSDHAKFKHLSFEQLICLRYQRTFAHQVALSWIRAGNSVGYENASTAPFESDDIVFSIPFNEQLPLPMDRSTSLCLELERHRKLVEHVVGQPIAPDKVLPYLSSIAASDGSDLLITPFSGGKIKNYPLHLLEASLKEIFASVSIPMILAGGPADKVRLQQFCAVLRSQGLPRVEVQVPGSVTQFASLIAKAKAVLTVDTSAAHLATTLDKPTVVILGGGHYGTFGPWHRSARQRWLTNMLPCFGCNWSCIYPKPICITEISPQTVARAVLDILSMA